MDKTPAFQAHSLDDGPVSFSLGLYRCLGNAALYRRLLDRFLTSRITLPADIRHEWQQGNFATAALIAHSAVSSSANVGATALSEAARALEAAIVGNADEVEARLSDFGAQHAMAVEAMRVHVAN